MKKCLVILAVFSIVNLHGSLAYAQTAPRTEKSPITEITKAFETPPDMLNETLNKVKRLEATTTAKPADEDLTSESDPDTFRNPFVPQTPQPVKTIDDNTTSVPVQQIQRERPVVPIPVFTLSGLIWNTKKPAAILNGKIVAIGDQVSNWSVSEITKEGVHVTFEDQNLWVKPVIDPIRNKLTQPNPRNYR